MKKDQLKRLFRSVILHSPKHNNQATKRPLEQFVEQQSKLSEIFQYCFSGVLQKEVEISIPEPFSQPELIRTLTSFIKDMDAYSTIHIHGRDLVVIDENRDLLSELRKNELLAMFITFDKFTVQQIEGVNISRLFDHFEKLGIKNFKRYHLKDDESVEESMGLHACLDLFKQLLSLDMRIERPDVYTRPELHDSSMPFYGDLPEYPCRENLHLVLKDNGDVFPCIVGTLSPQLAIGNWIEEQIETIIDRLLINDRFVALTDKGPMSLIEENQEAEANNQLSRHYLDPCHACRILHKNVLKETSLLN